MIDVVYGGRFGNWLFQYSYANILAYEIGDLCIATLPTNPILCGNEQLYNNKQNLPIVYIDEQLTDPVWICPSIRQCDRTIYKLNGYFQRFYLYEKYTTYIKKLFIYDDIIVDNYDDVVMHIRLTDYKTCNGGIVVDPNKYINLLGSLKFNKLYIVTDDQHDQYLNIFKSLYDCVIVSQDIRHDFYYMMRFDKIICANSTFSWWAAFFSNAQYKYIPYDMGFCNSVDLWKIGKGY